MRYEVYAEATRILKHRDQNRIVRETTPGIMTVLKKQRRLFMAEYKRTKGSFPDPDSDALVFGPVPPWEYQTTLLDAWDRVASATERELQNTILDIEYRSMSSGSARLATSLNISTALNLENPRAVNWFAEHGGNLRYIKDINETTRDRILTVVKTGLDEGRSYFYLGKEIQQLTAFSAQRAHLIAITETAQAYESGNHILGQELQARGLVMEHRWNDSGDDRVTEECMENSAAGWIPLNEPFPSGHDHPPRFPGCRCYTTTRRAEGELQPEQTDFSTIQPEPHTPYKSIKEAERDFSNMFGLDKCSLRNVGKDVADEMAVGNRAIVAAFRGYGGAELNTIKATSAGSTRYVMAAKVSSPKDNLERAIMINANDFKDKKTIESIIAANQKSGFYPQEYTARHVMIHEHAHQIQYTLEAKRQGIKLHTSMTVSEWNGYARSIRYHTITSEIIETAYKEVGALTLAEQNAIRQTYGKYAFTNLDEYHAQVIADALASRTPSAFSQAVLRETQRSWYA